MQFSPCWSPLITGSETRTPKSRRVEIFMRGVVALACNDLIPMRFENEVQNLKLKLNPYIIQNVGPMPMRFDMRHSLLLLICILSVKSDALTPSSVQATYCHHLRRRSTAGANKEGWSVLRLLCLRMDSGYLTFWYTFHLCAM